MVAITIDILPELAARLKKLCHRRNRSASDVLREALQRYLTAEELRDLRHELRPYAKAVGVLIDEDVLRIDS